MNRKVLKIQLYSSITLHVRPKNQISAEKLKKLLPKSKCWPTIFFLSGLVQIEAIRFWNWFHDKSAQTDCSKESLIPILKGPKHLTNVIGGKKVCIPAVLLCLCWQISAQSMNFCCDTNIYLLDGKPALIKAKIYPRDPWILAHVKKKKTFFRLLSRQNKLDLCGLFVYWMLTWPRQLFCQKKSRCSWCRLVLFLQIFRDLYFQTVWARDLNILRDCSPPSKCHMSNVLNFDRLDLKTSKLIKSDKKWSV